MLASYLMGSGAATLLRLLRLLRVLKLVRAVRDIYCSPCGKCGLCLQHNGPNHLRMRSNRPPPPSPATTSKSGYTSLLLKSQVGVLHELVVIT